MFSFCSSVTPEGRAFLERKRKRSLRFSSCCSFSLSRDTREGTTRVTLLVSSSVVFSRRTANASHVTYILPTFSRTRREEKRLHSSQPVVTRLQKQKQTHTHTHTHSRRCISPDIAFFNLCPIQIHANGWI